MFSDYRYLHERGGLYTLHDGIFQPVEADHLAHPTSQRILADPTSDFFRIPFDLVCFAREGKLLESFSMTPGDFNPGSPFSTFQAVRANVHDGTLLYPRMYLYPTAACNSRCQICQFENRHRIGAHLSVEAMEEALGVLRAHRGTLSSQALIVSGDGEPTIYPHIDRLLELAGRDGLRVFLTTNLLVSPKARPRLYELLAASCRMITVSIKGLSPDAYRKHQGRPGFDQAMRHLEMLCELREQCGNTQLNIGVASLILPENTGTYAAMTRRFAALGIDYVYLNQVEPSPERWGIVFTEEQKTATLAELAKMPRQPGLLVRYADNPFMMRYDSTAYYDAAENNENPICGSALLNPLVLAGADGNGRWMACRNSELFEDEAYRFEIKDGVVDGASVSKVMRACQKCHTCRLERQVKHIDRLYSIETRYDRGEYLLRFDLAREGGHLSFDQVAQ